VVGNGMNAGSVAPTRTTSEGTSVHCCPRILPATHGVQSLFKRSIRAVLATGASPRLRAVAVDVDGTLLNSHHQVSQPTREAVQAAQTHDVIVVLTSSRGPAELKAILLGLRLTAPTPFVAAQGALTGHYDSTGRLTIEHEQRLPMSSARRLAAAATAAGVGVNWYDGERWITPQVDAAIEEEARIVGHDPEVADPLRETTAPHKVLLITDRQRPDAFDGLLFQFPSDLAFHRSKAGYLEVTAADVDKAVAFDQLCSTRGIGVEERAAIGDGLNDLGLFAIVGISVAMGHAPAEVRQKASLVTGTNDEHGVAQALQGLIQDPS
jgi:Cof subfamily protein (haloacid dehalogenase superfamily)